MKRTSQSKQWRRQLAGLCVMGLVMMAPPSLSAGMSFSQDSATGLYSVSATGKTAKDVLKYIESNSDYVFLYGEGVERKLSSKVDIQLKDKKMDAVLAEVCKAVGLNYKVNGRQVTINVARQAEKAPAGKGPVEQIKGTVLDEEGEPLIGASVRLKGTDQAVVTDIDGNFVLNGRRGQKVQVSYVGYNPTDVTYNGGAMKIDMTGATNVLN
ncbi:MAG: carboxypeptidase-like regulatory domain-containing protein, partial [Muribaculaceae bacterium]|nr:carboxypeptidase-like regulatory domain-containing protein [Muribaculaceae bacterium]